MLVHKSKGFDFFLRLGVHHVMEPQQRHTDVYFLFRESSVTARGKSTGGTWKGLAGNKYLMAWAASACWCRYSRRGYSSRPSAPQRRPARLTPPREWMREEQQREAIVLASRLSLSRHGEGGRTPAERRTGEERVGGTE